VTRPLAYTAVWACVWKAINSNKERRMVFMSMGFRERMGLLSDHLINLTYSQKGLFTYFHMLPNGNNEQDDP
jgi:hypothetical protein